MDHAISVYTLGAFELAIHGKPVQQWKAGKARDLFQFLLLRQGHVVPRETLHEALWPGSFWSASSSSLKVAVHALRRVLANYQASPGGTSTSSLRLVTRETGYTLQTSGLWVDSEVFDDLVDQGHRAESAGARQEAGRHYRAAAELYGGDFLAGAPMEWASVHREWLRSRFLYVLQQLAESSMLEDNPLSVMRYCRRILEIEPYREESYRMLMYTHAQLGQLNQVRRWYDICATRLREDLQAAPEPATRLAYSRAMHGRLDADSWESINCPGHTAAHRERRTKA
ncbi:AfsR/SARP family transcriptional regulator [Streptomyces genisteinicus]|uniref:Winged helix-turn-helix domain-containing protein n=1 Tax=Streptomyces genisteinicus TaxID=2768068 RepID=A0A7H0I1H1_9ACTN|nr:BTAD domain-containing putative transcriptional regulator [Streptomyces genisteinicus]QNP66637.1 winged helix-turn-helix domain-containing protein [Streptomyces genisteinicus]